MKKEISVWDLPIEKVYVGLEEGFRSKFFKLAYERHKSWNKLGNYLSIKRADTLIAKNWKNGICCIPLSVIAKIMQEINLPPEEIEKNIIEIKYKSKLNKRGGSSGKPLIYPKLPIKINEDFIEILGHICGDGNISRSNPKKGISFRYVNSEKKLIESFKEKINNVFGDIEPNIQVRSGFGYRRENFCLQYPSIISLFVLTIFDCFSNEQKDLPDFVFELSKDSKCSFLRALFDDEGTVSIRDKRVCIGLKPKKVVEKIRNLLIDLGFTPGSVYFSGNIHKININRREDIVLFKKIIGFKHPSKAEKLDLIIKKGWRFYRTRNGETQNKIVSFLEINKMASTQELVQYLNRCPDTTRQHLTNLKNNGLIVSKRNYRMNVWSLT